MFGGISIWQLVIVLLLVVLLFGTKKLRNLGSDLGGALKGFKKSMATAEDEEKKDNPDKILQSKTQSATDSKETATQTNTNAEESKATASTTESKTK